MAKGKHIQHSGCNAFALWEDAKSELEELQEEMETWKDSLEERNLGESPKFDEVSECYDALEAAMQEAEDLADLDGLWTGLHEGIEYPPTLTASWSEFQAYKGKSMSRADRLGNVESQMGACKEAIESFGADQTDANEDGEVSGAVQAFVDEAEKIGDCIAEFENVCFPGMFG